MLYSAAEEADSAMYVLMLGWCSLFFSPYIEDREEETQSSF